MTSREYAELLSRKPHLAPKSFQFTKAHDNSPCPELQNPKPERDQAPALGQTVQGEEKGMERAVVRFIGYRTRPLDPDNFTAGLKDLIDGLRHVGLLAGDEWWRIRLETEQVKVAHRKDERTEIVIEYP